ncbi:hypothetical protein ABIA32_002700 [Streptacidiphilus sp. MAP12-20]|uniref:hypothetical protein n=1 Tax=Streptacidiphilus sp. MAP12-20 TaxID=3156299 RepID=UPI003515A627
MTQPAPTIGRIVHYTLHEHDAAAIQHRRKQAGTLANFVEEGQTYPAIVVRVWSPDSGSANIRVLLDGNDDLWVTSATPANEPTPGRWNWPPRA